MSKLKRGLSLLLVALFALTIVMAGCNRGSQPADTSKGGASPATESKKASEPAKTDVPKENVTLTWYLVGNGQEPDTDKVCEEANKYLKDKLNVNIKLQVFGWGDEYNQKVNTALASGEPIDIVFTASWAANYNVNAGAGYLLELNDLLNKYPTIKNILGEDFLNGSAINGKNYAVPCNKEKVHNWGYLVQKSLAQKYGLDPSKIKKMEDMDPYFEKVKNGENGITPLLVVCGDAPFQFLDWDRISDDDVPGALYPDNRNNTIINHFEAPESIDMYKKMREYYKKGYIHPDAATMQNTAEEMKSGKYFAVEQSLKPGKDAEMFASTGIEWVQIDITQPVMTNRETTGSLLAIPARSKNPERAFRFIEMLYTDKYLRNLFVYGIENVHYKKVSENVIQLTDNKGYRAGNGWRFGDQFKDYLLDNEDPQKWVKFEEFNKKGLPMRSLGFIFDKSPVETEIGACKNVIQTYYKQLFTGSVEVDDAVAKMSKDLKDAGVEALIAEMQKQYNAWLEKTGKK